MKRLLSILLLLTAFTVSANPYIAVLSGSVAAVGGGTSPGLVGIHAWYDFADAADADGGTFNLAENNSPTYTAGPPSYGTAADGTPAAHWSQTTVDNAFANASGDWSLVIRFRGHTSVSNGDRVISGNGGRWRIAWGANIDVVGANIAATTSTAPSLTTWYLVVLSYDAGLNELKHSVNGEAFVTTGGTGSFATGTYFFGATGSSDSNNYEIDYVGFYTKELTQDNVAWLYNSGGTRTYSEL